MTYLSSDLLISVTGGAKSFNVSHDICGSFQQGLLSAAKSTNAWLITGGQNCVSDLLCAQTFYPKGRFLMNACVKSLFRSAA
jgi:hypothetical protein